jgi:hypothetical protein
VLLAIGIEAQQNGTRKLTAAEIGQDYQSALQIQAAVIVVASSILLVASS